MRAKWSFVGVFELVERVRGWRRHGGNAAPPVEADTVIEDERAAGWFRPRAIGPATRAVLSVMLSAMKLSGAALQRLQRALLAAFPTRSDLAQLVRFALNQNLDEVAASSLGLEAGVFELLRWAEARGRLPALIAFAQKERPLSDEFRAFVKDHPEVIRNRAPFHVPFLRNEHFVGREEDLTALHALLRESGTVGVRPAALVGMGGIGKTQLAVEYAYLYMNAYTDGVYWVNAAESWQAELAALAELVGLREDGAPESDRQRRLALAFVSYLAERPDTLVIFDNVEDPRNLRRPLLGVVPAQLKCRLLFTSRVRDDAGDFARFDIRVLPEEAALRLLLEREARREVLISGDTVALREAKEICRILGYLPLALALAGGYLGKNPEITLADYRERLLREDAFTTLDESGLTDEDLLTRHVAAVHDTLHVSWKALKVGGAEQRVLRAAALLQEAAAIPRARLGLLTGLEDRAEKGYAAPLGGALRRLRELSLIEELSEKEVRLHPLVREFAETQIVERAGLAGECAGRLEEALWDMGRLHREVAERGIDAVLGDLRIGRALAGRSSQRRIDALLRALDRESHALRKWDGARGPGFFLQQLRNTCFEMGIEGLQERAEATLAERGWPWLRERIHTNRESEALIRTLEGHGWVVTGVAVTASGRFAISSSWDTTLKVWDLDSGKAVRSLQGHTDMVNGVVVMAKDRFVVSASDDKTLKVWDLDSGKTIRSLQGHTGSVTGVAGTADGRFVVSASDDKTLKVWDLDSGKVIHSLHGHTKSVTGVAVTVDGRLAISASNDMTLKVWDLNSGKVIHSLHGHAKPVTGVVLTNDGRFAVSASDDMTLKLWDLGTGEIVRSLQGHSERVTGVALTPDERFAISTSEDRTLKLWDLGTGEALRSLQGHSERVTGVALTPDGRFAVSTSDDMTLKVWELGSEKTAPSLEGHTKRVTGVAVTADGRFAVSASEDRTLKVWDLRSGNAIRSFIGHAKGVFGVALTADGRFAVSASWDKTLKVWDLESGNLIHSGEGLADTVADVAVTEHGRFEVSTFDGHVTGVTATENERFSVSVSEDPTLTVWDRQSGKTVHSLAGHTSVVNGVAITTDGRFAVSVSWDKTLKVWDLSTSQPVATLETRALLSCCAIAPDGKTILAGDRAGSLHILDRLPDT